MYAISLAIYYTDAESYMKNRTVLTAMPNMAGIEGAQEVPADRRRWPDRCELNWLPPVQLPCR
jgi:hypothetical protein